MLKKILLILTTALCCVSCMETTIRENDVLLVKGVELNEYIAHNSKYRYHIQCQQYYKTCGKTFVENFYYYSDSEFKVGDTLQIKLK